MIHLRPCRHGRVPLSPPPAIASINDELPVSNVGRGAGGGGGGLAVARGGAVMFGGSRGGSLRVKMIG